MADPFADPDDVAARWRPLTAAETTTAQALLQDASALIRQRFPGIDSQVTSGAVDPGILTMVAANMVKRALVTPDDGVAQETQGMGPFSRGQTYANPLQNVFFTQADLLAIIGYQPGAASHRYGNTTTRRGQDGYFATIYGAPF